MAGGGPGPARRPLRRHDPLLPKAPAAAAARAGRAGRLVRARAPRAAGADPRAAGPGPHARAHRPRPRRRARRHRRPARGRGRPRRRGSARGVPHARRARRALGRSRSRCSKPSPARTCSSRACTTARRATRPPTSRSCNRACGLLEQGLPLPDLLALAHEHHETTRDIAETAVGLFDRYVRAPLRASDLPDDEKAEQLVEAFRVLLPAVTTLVAHHFRRVLLEVAQEHLESVGEDDRARGGRTSPPRAGSRAGRREPRHRRRVADLPDLDDKPRVVEAMFDRIAPRYDALNRVLTFRMDVAWRRTAVDALALAARVASARPRVRHRRPLPHARARRSRPGRRRLLGRACCAPRTPTRPLVRADALRLPVRRRDVRRAHVRLRAAQLRRARAGARRVRPGAAPRRSGRAARRRRAREPARPRRCTAPGSATSCPFVGGLVSDRAAYRYLPASTAYLPPLPELLGARRRRGNRRREPAHARVRRRATHHGTRGR